MKAQSAVAGKSISALIYRNYLTSCLIPIVAIELVLLFLYFGINLYISGKNQETLLHEATRNVQEIAHREVLSINAQLKEVLRLALLMKRDHEAFFASSAECSPATDKLFSTHANGSYFKKTDNGGASLYYASSTRMGPDEKRKASCSEILDPLLKSIVEVSALVNQAYLNTWDNMNRLYPFMPDAPAQYGPKLRMEDYNFYYEANARHNPSRKPVWTGAYLDPAGRGWMVSLIVPIYRGDFLEGVSGLDVTIESFVQNILHLDMPWNGSSLMVDPKGVILAMQPGAEKLLGIRELKTEGYAGRVQKTVEKPDRFNLLSGAGGPAHAQLSALFQSKQDMRIADIAGVRYLVSQQIVPETGWHLITLIEESRVLEPISRLKQLSDRIGYAAIVALVLFYLAFFIFVQRKSRRLAMQISAPIEQLSASTKNLGASLKAHVLQPVGIEELDQLSEHFNTMSGELEMRTNALMEAKAAAETANRSKSLFLANMSHELRTPMNAIMGMTELAMAQASSPEQLRQLETVSCASEHLLRIIEDVLDISKIETGKLRLENKPFRIGNVLEKVSDILAQPASEKGLELVVKIDPALASQWAVGDALRIEQILLNLGTNGVKFCDKGSVTLRALLIADHGKHLDIRFDVRDTGLGVGPDAISRLFIPFEQLDNSATRQHGGTGLGLAISKRLATLMGGDIGVQSGQGVGSTFWLDVQLEKAAKAVPPLVRESQRPFEKLVAQHAGARILLVEDNDINREIAMEFLRDSEIRVDVAEDGSSAIRLAQRVRYDLVLMDLYMPDMSGLDATRAIRQLPAYRDVPIVAMTASASAEDKQRCAAAGMNDYLSKPIAPDVFYTVLCNWLRHSKLKAETSSAGASIR